MNLQKLIEQNRLEEISDVSIEQIKKRFSGGMRYFNVANNLLDSQGANSDSNVVIYTNLYNAARITGEVLLLMNGYRAKIIRHHETVIHVARFLMNDDEMRSVFNRLDRMRKNRNTMEYDMDTLDVSSEILGQALGDVQKFAKKVEALIGEKDEQQQLV